jgi:hypothetical protein
MFTVVCEDVMERCFPSEPTAGQIQGFAVAQGGRLFHTKGISRLYSFSLGPRKNSFQRFQDDILHRNAGLALAGKVEREKFKFPRHFRTLCDENWQIEPVNLIS